jgi:NADPH:quinone reductase-like Zn-dependent oxidoreductase
MRQVIITKAGSPDVLQVVQSPTPEPGPGDVRIKVEAIGVNFADIMGRLGIYADAPKIPYVPGYEVAGTIEAVGEGVDSKRIGQRVAAITRFNGYSEILCAPENHLFAIPDDLPFDQAAAFPVAYLTAYESLIALAGIKSGEHVLIHAAAGGVGLAAVDICKIYDATIYGTASASKHDFLRERGVHHPIDYRHKDFEREIKRLTNGHGVQIAIDSIGGRSWLKSYRSLSPTGRLVMMGISTMAPGKTRSWWAQIRTALTIPWIQFNPVALTNDNKGVMGVNVGHLWGEETRVQAWADQLLAWHQQGRLHMHVDRVFKLEEAADAHRYIQERRNIGKIVLIP